jgi:nucleolar protein 56
VRADAADIGEEALARRLTQLLRGSGEAAPWPTGAIEPGEPPRERLRAALIRAGREMLRGSLSPDVEIIWAVRALDEMQKQINSIAEMREGWGRAWSLAGGAGNDQMGASLGLGSLEAVAEHHRKTAAELDSFLESRMRALAPSVAEACGPKLGAQLIELAGGLKELALKPSSTVQVMGAEKAMFRHLRGDATPPKHGVIFQHPTVQFAPKKERGKAARKLAARIVMAARKDAFGARRAE